MTMDGLPLFVLGPDFFPGFTGTLRVFEPRYKQMMDDCIMDSRPFGYISADPSKGELNGWSQPSDHGVLCYVRDYEESGSNLIIEVEAGSAFSIESVTQPVLPRLIDEEKYPGVEELMEQAGNPTNGKLYLMANVVSLDFPKVDYDSDDFYRFIEAISPVEEILRLSSSYKGQILEVCEVGYYKSETDRSDLIWKVCNAICYDPYLQRKMLSQTSFLSLLNICRDRIDQILFRINEEE